MNLQPNRVANFSSFPQSFLLGESNLHFSNYLAVKLLMWLTFGKIWMILRFCARWKDNCNWNIIVKKNSKMKMKNEKEKKNQLPVELCYKYHFYMSEASSLEDHHCENFLKNIYLIMQPKVDQWLTPKCRKNSCIYSIILRGVDFFLLHF